MLLLLMEYQLGPFDGFELFGRQRLHGGFLRSTSYVESGVTTTNTYSYIHGRVSYLPSKTRERERGLNEGERQLQTQESAPRAPFPP